mgnify:CR=1 FL=1
MPQQTPLVACHFEPVFAVAVVVAAVAVVELAVADDAAER